MRSPGEIPTYRMLSMSMDELRSKGNRLLRRLKKVPGLSCALSQEEGQVGGGQRAHPDASHLGGGHGT